MKNRKYKIGSEARKIVGSMARYSFEKNGDPNEIFRQYSNVRKEVEDIPRKTEILNGAIKIYANDAGLDGERIVNKLDSAYKNEIICASLEGTLKNIESIL